MKIALVRHGETDWNRRGLLQGVSNIPLNERGSRQALDTAHLLAHDEWGAIVSSPLSRAEKTASIIADHLGSVTERPHPDLVERDFGEHEGAEGAVILQKWPDLDGPGMEPATAVAERGARALTHIASLYAPMNVIVVCHSFLISYTLERLGQPLETDIPNGAVFYLDVDEGLWTVTGRAFPDQETA